MAAGALTVRLDVELPYRPPLDWDSLLGFLGRRAIPGVELVSKGRYRRTIALEGGAGIVRVKPGRGGAALELAAELPDPGLGETVAERARRIFDLDSEPRTIDAALGTDPLLAETVSAYPGLRVPGCWDGFELAVRAILGQQVTVRGAATLAARMVRAYGEPVAHASQPGLGYLFPTPRSLLDADLAEVGLTRARAATLRSLAREAAAGRISFDPAADRAACLSTFRAIRGVGEWTAQYVAMRALRDPDAFPATDLVLLRAAEAGGDRLTPRQLAERAEGWRPWRAYAAVHLWRRSS